MALVNSILLVDDDADDQEIFKTALLEVSKSVHFFTAGDGSDALMKLRTDVALPELILLDMNMPVMDGLETLRQLKGDEKLKQIPVIVYSTTITPGFREETQALGAAKFIIKPSNFSDLCQFIISLVEPGKEDG